MCGISGIYAGHALGDERRLIEYATLRQVHRGPDHQAVESVRDGAGALVLGHCRLMILDLSAEAHHPLWDHERRVCLVANGEIYNYVELRAELAGLGHRFATRSDMEVVLEAWKEWGPGALERLNGMFAFGLYDRDEGRLVLVRDRFGVKPLYYVAERDRLEFASTPEAIARPLGLAPDPRYLAHGLHYWVYDHGELAPFAGMRALAPGHYLEARADASGHVRTVVRRYYALEDRVAAATEAIRGLREPELVERFAALFERAVEIRLRADVPVGVSLSSGLDSSTVAAVAAPRASLTGFTFGHPDDPATEGRAAGAVARHVGVAVRYVRPTPREIVRAYFACLEAQGAPFPNASVVGQFLMYRAAREAGVKVVLGGQGGDEAFMGYRKFQLFHLRQLLARRRYAAALGHLAALAPVLASDGSRLAACWRHRQRYTRPAGIESVLHLPVPEPLELGADPRRPLWERQARDVTEVSLPTLLRYEDRSSMAHGVESRLPFLDHPLVEFALALGVPMKLRRGFGKWIVREFARGRIPESVRTSRDKRGFDVAQERWIGQGLGAAIREALQARRAGFRDYLCRGVRFDRAFSDERLQHSPAAFAEATTLIWLGDQSGD